MGAGRDASVVSGVAALLVGLCLCTAAQAADDPASEALLEIIREQREFIEAQKLELGELRRRVEHLEGGERQLERGEQQLERAPEQITEHVEPEVEKAKQEAPAAVEGIDPVDLSSETDRMRYHPSHHFNFEATGTKLTLAGFVKADVIHDFREIDTPTQFVTSSIDVPGGSGSQTSFSANASRFLIGSATPTPVGRLTTLVSMDFFGNRYDRTPDPRLLQAWGQLDDFLFGFGLRAGQSWSSFDDVPALPDTLDFEGPNGSDQTRHGLVRLERKFGDDLRLWVALEDPSSDIDGGDSRTRSPDGVLSLIYQGKWGHVKPTALFRDVGANAGSGTQREFGWAVSASGLIDLPFLGQKGERNDDLRFQFSYGQGYGEYVNDDVSDAIIAGSDLELLPVFSGYVAYQHWWLATVRSNAVFGWVDVNNRGLEPAAALDRTLYAAGNLIWSPVKQVDLGTEFLWGQRRNKNDQTGYALRLQFSGQYKF